MRIGILGLGSIGARHANNAVDLGHEVDFYDPVRQTYPDSKVRFQYRGHVLATSDAIVVASPSNCHGIDFQDAVHTGCHVLVEKPFGYDCPPLLDGYLQAKRGVYPGLIVATGFNLRFHACVGQTKKLMPELGELLSASFVVRQKTEKEPYLRDGIIRNWCSHEIDLAHYLLGPGKVSTCVAHTDEHGKDTIDATMILDFDNVKGDVYLDADYYTDPEQRYFWIEGSKANVYVDLVKRTVFWHDKRTGKRHQVLAATDTYDDNYIDEMATFMQSIEQNHHQAPLATGEDGIRALYTVMDARAKAGLSG